MTIPRVLEILAIRINAIQKESMQKPEVHWVLDVEKVNTLKAGEECSPLASKMCADFHPKTLDSSITC